MVNHKMNVGDEFFGFRLEEIHSLEEYSGNGYLLKHLATGMEVYYVANDDKELFFSFLFNTMPSNNSGVAHIIEHSVLAGSKKYPLRDPFMHLQKGSANTFMNALTYPTKTLYPAASPLEKDFDNIFKVYSDAVFAPLLREETFMQEGIRLHCDEDGNFSYKGVVFNEMLGDRNDAEYLTNSTCLRLLYPDTPYSFNSGGEPLDIVDLDYRKFKSFYDQYYHPTNCKLFLYGDLDLKKYLKLLNDEYLSGYAKIKISEEKLIPSKWEEPRQTTISCPCNDDDKRGTVALAFATTDSSDSLEVITLSFIYELLLGSNGCPLYKAMIDSGIGENVSNVCGVSSDYNLMPFIVAFSKVKESYSSEDVENFIINTITKIATDGFDQTLVDATLKRLTFQIQEKPNKGPMGMIALRRAMRGWLRGFSPISTIEFNKSVDLLKQKMKENTKYLSTWLMKNIVNNSHRLLLTSVPDKEFINKYQEKLTKKLTEVTESFDDETRDLFREKTIRFERFQNEGDTQDALATVPKLTIDDLPKQIRKINHRRVKDLQVPIWKLEMETNGIVYFDFVIHVEDFNERELLLLPLYTKILERCAVADMDNTKVMTEVMNYTGGFQIVLEGGSKTDGDRLNCFLGRVKMLEQDFKDGLDLTKKIIKESHVDDYKVIWESVINFKEIYSSIASSYGYKFATLAASSVFSENGKVMEDTVGITQWLFLNSIKREDIGSIAVELNNIQNKLFNRKRYELHLTCEKEVMNSCLDDVHEFIKSFKVGEEIKENHFDKTNYNFETLDNRQAFLLPASVNHTCHVIPTDGLGSKNNSVARVLSSILTGNELWNSIRVVGGAYGVDCHVDSLEKMFIFISASDPNLSKTFENYRNGLQRYAENPVDEQTISDAIISNVAFDLKPFGPSTLAIVDFRRILFNIKDDLRESSRKYILEVKSEDLQKLSSVLLSNKKTSSVVVADPTQYAKEQPDLKMENIEGINLPI